jgi:hypothetical protein
MTAQAQDILIYEDETYWINAEPLENYFKEWKEKPFEDHDISACWRGYIATWMLRENQLVLISLKPYADQKLKASIEDIFPNQKEVLAGWFNGEIKITRGQELEPFYNGSYDSLFEEEEILEIKWGKLIGVRLIDNRNIDLTEYRKLQSKRLW